MLRYGLYETSSVVPIKKELDFIKTNRVNSLEMLFEAEKHEENSLETHKLNDILNFQEDEYSEELHSLLSNPDELIKALKNKSK